MASVAQREIAENGLGALEGESSEAWAKRVVSPFRGLLREEIKAFGGADALMRWLRSDEQDEA